MLRFNCPSCGMALAAPEDCVGRSTKCRKCGQPVTVPQPVPATPPAATESPRAATTAAPPEPAPPVAPPPRRPVPPPLPAAPAVEELPPAAVVEDNPEPVAAIVDEPFAEAVARPARRPAQAGPSKPRAFLFLGAVALMLIGVVLIIVPLVNALTRARLGAEISDTPEKISLAKLIERGTSGNANLALSNFAFGEKVVTVRRSARPAGTWDWVWVPVYPVPRPDSREAEGKGGVLRALVKNKEVHDQDGLGQLRGRQELQGLVINKLESLPAAERELLEKQYPGTDFDQVLLIEADRLPPARASSGLGFYLVGGLMVLAGVPLAFVAGWRNLVRVLAADLARGRRRSGEGAPAGVNSHVQDRSSRQ